MDGDVLLGKAPCWLVLLHARDARLVKGVRCSSKDCCNEINLDLCESSSIASFRYSLILLSSFDIFNETYALTLEQNEKIAAFQWCNLTHPCRQILQRKMKRGKHELAPGDYCNYKMRKAPMGSLMSSKKNASTELAEQVGTWWKTNISKGFLYTHAIFLLWNHGLNWKWDLFYQ